MKGNTCVQFLCSDFTSVLKCEHIWCPITKISLYLCKYSEIWKNLNPFHPKLSRDTQPVLWEQHEWENSLIWVEFHALLQTNQFLAYKLLVRLWDVQHLLRILAAPSSECLHEQQVPSYDQVHHLQQNAQWDKQVTHLGEEKEGVSVQGSVSF